MRILVIDDEFERLSGGSIPNSYMAYYVDALTKSGFCVTGATSFASARAELNANIPFDVFSLDYNLPDCDGEVGAEWLCRNYPAIPIVFLTGCRANSLDFAVSRIPTVVGAFEKSTTLPYHFAEAISNVIKQYSGE